MKNGSQVAVKRFWNTATTPEEHDREVSVLSNLRHENIVRLLGHCFQDKERLFVYEFLPNGDLLKFCTKGFPLTAQCQHDWARLLKIIKGVAAGLQYLHNNSLVHMDLKPANILLDSRFTAKVGDFDLLRKLDVQQTHQTTQHRHGTPEFVSPEFLEKGHCSPQHDIYGFGKLVLMIIIEHQRYSSTEYGDVVQYVWEHWNAGTLNQVLENFSEGNDREQAQKWVHIALLCLQHERSKRPTIERILEGLQFEMKLEEPNLPGFMKSVTNPNISNTKSDVLSRIQNIELSTEDNGSID